MYPLFWMLPVNDEYGAWPKSGEINIAAYTFGGYWGNQYEKNTVSAWLYTENTANGVPMEPGIGSAATMEDAYHLYSMVWKKKRIQFLLDNKVIFTYDKRTNTSAEWPFDKDFYLLMSLAVGGVEGGAFGIDTENFPKRMEVDYVRYYELLQDDETDEVEDSNLITNGGFEQDFEEGKEPLALVVDKGEYLNHLGQWLTKAGKGSVFEVDNTVGFGNSRNSLKFANAEIKNYWDYDISLPIEGQKAGTYKFSFYLKTNKSASDFTASITFCETMDELLNTSGQYHKAVWVKNDGTQQIAKAQKEYGGHPHSAIYGQKASEEWKQFSVIVQLPDTEFIRFLIKPNAISTSGGQWPGCTTDTDVIFWFDNFSFEKVD